MNTKNIYREINKGRLLINKKEISYPTVRKFLKLGYSPEEIVKMEIKHGGYHGAGKTKTYKLSESDFKRAKYFLDTGYSILEVSKIYGVSKTYFDYHKKLKRF